MRTIVLIGYAIGLVVGYVIGRIDGKMAGGKQAVKIVRDEITKIKEERNRENDKM